MANHPLISNHLDETEGFSDKEVPVMITSGESLTPFFINTEKLCRDGDISDVIEKHADYGSGIIEHSVGLTKIHPEFKKDIEIISQKVDSLFKNNKRKLPVAVSGGQRRDWIFSGPVARHLDIPHISLYKQTVGSEEIDDKVEILWKNRVTESAAKTEFYVVQLGDLNTTGSSLYRIDPQTKRELGWIPLLRQYGAEVNDTVIVVSRLQGGEEKLLEINPPVNTYYFVAIDEEFLRSHSKQPDAALAYINDQKVWTQNYLLENGTGVIVPYFEPESSKLDRAKKFYHHYSQFLEESGLAKDLDNAVKEKYKTSLDKIVEVE